MRVSFLGASAPALALIATTASAATIDLLPQGDFDFGARNLGPAESTVSLQAVAENRDDGTQYRACTMSTFKEGRATAIPGVLYDTDLESGLTPLEAAEKARYQDTFVDRDSYRVDAAYIIVSESPEGDDFVRINVGAPQQEEARLFIGEEELSQDVLTYEYSNRYGHPNREAESYTILIEDPAAIAQIRDALASQEEITVIPRSVLNDYVLPYTFQGNVDLTEAFSDCLENVDDMSIAMGTFPSWTIGGMLTADVSDVLTLAAMLEDEDALANPGAYQIANILATEGMFAIGPHALQEMMNGEVLTTSQGEYASYNHLTGTMTVSPDVLEFVDNNWNSCSCTIDFRDPPTFGYNPGTPGGSTTFLTSLLTGGGFTGGSTFFGGGSGFTGGGDNVTPLNGEVPLPPTGLLLLSALGIGFRKQIIKSDMATRGVFLAGAISHIGPERILEKAGNDLADLGERIRDTEFTAEGLFIAGAAADIASRRIPEVLESGKQGLVDAIESFTKGKDKPEPVSITLEA